MAGDNIFLPEVEGLHSPTSVVKEERHINHPDDVLPAKDSYSGYDYSSENSKQVDNTISSVRKLHEESSEAFHKHAGQLFDEDKHSKVETLNPLNAVAVEPSRATESRSYLVKTGTFSKHLNVDTSRTIGQADRTDSSRTRLPDPDGLRQQSRTPSPRGGRGRPGRNSRSRSRGRGRDRSRSRGRARSWSRGSRGRSRSRSPYYIERKSRSPYNVDRRQERFADRGRLSGRLPSITCRDFNVGRCRRGTQCRFSHDIGRRQYDGHENVNPRDGHSSYQSRESYVDSRDSNDFSKNRLSQRQGSRFDDIDAERSDHRRIGKSTERCFDFTRGRCARGATCRYVHDDTGSRDGWNDRDEGRERLGGGGRSHDLSPENSGTRKAVKTPCMFFAQGSCVRRNCPFLHDSVPGSQAEGPASGAHGHNNYCSFGSQTNDMDVASQKLAITKDMDSRPVPVDGTYSAPGSASGYTNWSQSKKEPARFHYPSMHKNPSNITSRDVIEVPTTKNELPAPLSNTTYSNNRHSAEGDGQFSQKSGDVVTSGPELNATNLSSQSGSSQSAAPALSSLQNLPISMGLQNSTHTLPYNGQLQQFNYLVHQNGQRPLLSPSVALPVQKQTPGTQPQHLLGGHVALSQQGYSQNISMPLLSGQSEQNINYGRQIMPNLNVPIQTQQVMPSPQLLQMMANIQSAVQNASNQSQNIQMASSLPSASLADGSVLKVDTPLLQKVVTSEQAAKISDLSASLAQFLGSTESTGVRSSQPIMSAKATSPNAYPREDSSAANMGPNIIATIPNSTAAEQLIPPGTAAAAGPATAAAETTSALNAASLIAAENMVINANKDDAVVVESMDANGHEGTKSKMSKELKQFKSALVDFVKDLLKPSWKDGQLSREAHKTIVKKVVEKVTSAIDARNIPQTKEKIDVYLTYSREKLTKLVLAYVEKYVKAS